MADRDSPNIAVSRATTTGMTGGGFYNANSATQWAAIEAVLPWLREAARNLAFDVGTGAITFADFGCSEGANSIAVMRDLLTETLPLTDRPFQTVHSDLPTNDFSKLFLGLRPDGRSVFGEERIYSAAVVGSMYDQLLPPGSVSLATTFNAIGFLSKRPTDTLPGYILPNGPSAVRANGSVSEEDRAAFARQAQDDVTAFLKARAGELVPGGSLLMQVFGCKGEARTCDGLYDLLNDAVLDHVQRGEISRQIYEHYYQPVYFRNLNELTVPMADPASGAAELFTLEHAESYEVPVPFVEAFHSGGSLDRYAKDYVNFFRAFTEAVLRNALPDTPDRDSLIERIYATAEALLKDSPELYPFRYAAAATLLREKG